MTKLCWNEGEVMTTGNRKGTYYGAERRGERESVSVGASTLQGRDTWWGLCARLACGARICHGVGHGAEAQRFLLALSRWRVCLSRPPALGFRFSSG